MDLVAQRRRTMSRCQRGIVSGVTSSRSPWRRAFGITPARAASSARSAHSSFGRAADWRCRTTSWWRRIKISAIFCASSRRDSRSHATTRVIRRKTNRRLMIGDHYGPTAGRATVLVRAVDVILGTHRISVNLSRPWHKGNHPGLILARRLKRKAAQVWLFATRFDVPATNNGSENAIRGYKLAAKISGLLAHPRDPAAPLPHPLLPHHRPQRRPPPPRRHPRRTQRRPLDATPPSMIN